MRVNLARPSFPAFIVCLMASDTRAGSGRAMIHKSVIRLVGIVSGIEPADKTESDVKQGNCI
ncbi:MAG: hypothetical protein ACYDBJ_01120 [Aggregatilineales bacterium]